MCPSPLQRDVGRFDLARRRDRGDKQQRGDPTSGRPRRCVARQDTTFVVSCLSLFPPLPLTAGDPFPTSTFNIPTPTHHQPRPAEQPAYRAKRKRSEPIANASTPPPAFRTSHRTAKAAQEVTNHPTPGLVHPVAARVPHPGIPNTAVGKPQTGEGSPGGRETPNAGVKTPRDGEGSPPHQETPNTVVGKPHDGEGSPGGREPPNAGIRTPRDGEGSPPHQETPNTVVGKPHDGAKCPTPGLGH